MAYYHLTRRNLGEIAYLEPSFSRFSDYMEDSESGVCFAPSIESCYNSLPLQVGPGNLMYGYKNKVYYVYVAMESPKLYRPEVDDIDYTEERRSKERVKVRRKGKIRVLKVSPFVYEWV